MFENMINLQVPVVVQQPEVQTDDSQKDVNCGHDCAEDFTKYSHLSSKDPTDNPDQAVDGQKEKDRSPKGVKTK